jgi:hypothetical protein
MARGDEYEPERPRRHRQVARGYDADDDDDFDRRQVAKPQRSGLVLAVGIVEIVLAGLYLGCGVVGGAFGLCCAGGAHLMGAVIDQQAQFDPQVAQDAKDFNKAKGAIQTAAWINVAKACINLAIGTVMLPAGIGVLRRANWARFLTLGLAAITLLVEFVDVILSTVLVLRFNDPPIMTPGDLTAGIALLVTLLGFAGFAGTILLLPQYAREFA